MATMATHRLPVEHDGIQSSEDVGNVVIASQDSNVEAQVTHEGRVNINLVEKAQKLTKTLQERARWTIPLGEELPIAAMNYEARFQTLLGQFSGPSLNIAIHIVGSQGDIQPFIAIGQALSRPPYNHRVRLCTHPVYKDFVEENGLEFFSIGGDPATLMAYMVKNPGLFPGRESWRQGEVGKRRAEFAVILDGCWRSCIEAGNGMGGERKGAEPRTSGASVEEADRCFVADAIIANPPSYGHIHCAEKLGIPLHIMFTMPWSPTQYFPHPLASLHGSTSDPRFANYMSYTMMELLAWQGLGDVINGFRMKTLHLDAISPLWGHMLISRLKVPFTYIWSSSLIPKPPDWGPHINISGFSFLETKTSYQPPADLADFLEAGPPPVYIGFGSIVVDEPEVLTKVIFGAVKRAGVRALVSKGWGGLGEGDAPEGVFLLGSCPHDWLFQHVSCVVHHGGAGTSAIGIAMGRPTLVIPFFGDQPFWGAMIYRAGAGPEPVPYKELTEKKLAEGITRALEPDIQAAVKKMSDNIATENGAADAAASFLHSLNYNSMRCLICPDQVAVWRVKKTNLRLGALAATTLLNNEYITLRHLKLIRHRNWYIDEGATNPILGVIASVSDTIVKTWVITHDYFQGLSKTMHGEIPPRSPPSPPPEQRPEQQDSDAIEQPSSRSPVLASRSPVRAALSYSPRHLERTAYRMASKTFPDTKSRARHRKMHSWTPATQKTQRSKSMPSKEAHKKAHGRLYEASADTGQYVFSVMRTGLYAPVALFYNLANGFHNAPEFLLHDDTVRRRDNITGFGSGVKVAAKVKRAS